MKKIQKISPTNLPMRGSVLAPIVYWLALDHWNAPGWAYGVVGAMTVFVWILYISEQIYCEKVDVLKSPH